MHLQLRHRRWLHSRSVERRPQHILLCNPCTDGVKLQQILTRFMHPKPKFSPMISLGVPLGAVRALLRPSWFTALPESSMPVEVPGEVPSHRADAASERT